MRTTLSIATLAFVAVQAHGQLILPYAGTDPSASLSSFQITKSGAAGRANTLYISNASNTSDVLLVNTVGLGRAGYFTTTNAANVQMALRADSNGGGSAFFGLMTGTGKSGLFRIINAANSNNALQAQTSGSGAAFRSVAGTGLAGEFVGGVAVSGQVNAGTFVGNGSGITAVNAALLGGLSSSAFLQSIPVPLLLAGSDSAQIIKGENTSTSFNSAGVYGVAGGGTSINYGVQGQTASTGGFGVYGLTTSSSGFTHGVRGRSLSIAGRGVSGQVLALTGSTIGVFGEVNSNEGRGVFGWATGNTGATIGVSGQSQSNEGRGVSGQAYASSGTTYGTTGQSDSPSGFGVFSFGNMGASGSKPFRIDHPSDPENKYLLHYASESPMPQNFYVGNVVTDAKGYAWVSLPDYFAEINANFKYQLTIVDDADSDGFVMAKVSKEIRGNRFQVRTSAPNTKVSWRVEADRNDRWVQKNKPVDVIDKEGLEKGTYQQPELYGLGPERGMNYDRTKSTERPVEASRTAQLKR